MNDLNLRVSGGIGEKVKKPAAPISMPYWSTEIKGAAGEFFGKFLDSNSADNQLKLLKEFLNNHRDYDEREIIRFLVLLFWHADSKNPVKGFLKKHITESRTLCQLFTDTLTTVISSEIADKTSLYTDYIGTVTRLDACIDKFPPGATAVISMDIDIATYLVQCLDACIKTLGISSESNCTAVKSEPLAPTEINKIYDLVHLTLRLLLYTIQKVTDENRAKLSSMFEGIRSIVAELMSAKEVPMDTKSVSGIIYLTMHLFENGSNSWVKLLEEDRSRVNGTVNLSVYSAVATVIGAAELLAGEVGGQPAVLDLTDKILMLGDRYSSESSHILAVARTVLAISKCAARAGTALVSRLARFCWGHMDHHMDSVRHLAAQVMAHVVRASVGLQRQGDPSALDELFTSLSALGSSRKSYYVTLTSLADELGGGVLARSPDVIRDVIRALNTQAVQACATTFLETLLKKHMMQSDTEAIYEQWVLVILETVKRESDPAVLHILEKILTRAVQGDSRLLGYILPENRALSSYKGSDLKCTLLVLGVVRKSGVAYKRVSFEDLMHTAYDADDEIRLLALSLAAETPRSTEPLSSDELCYVLHYLDYNINAQSPSFRQLVLALIKKILKRLEDSYKVLKRKTEHATEVACYLQFTEDLRNLCFSSLVAGGNYGRRCAALQMLTWLQQLQLEGWERSWTEEQADILYNLLEDSYENNKALALDVLKNCPVELIKPVHSPSYVTDALAQASSTRPSDCVAASYRLLLLLSLPVEFQLCDEALGVPERRHFSVVSSMVSELRRQAARAQHIACAARDAPMYGLVHCLAGALRRLDARAIAGNESWSALVADIIATCEVVNSRVACVVNAASPEGLLPEELTDHTDSSGGARLADGCAVTAQMLLLCAWRSVKETSLLLGSLASLLTIEGEDPAWTLTARQVEHIGDCLSGLLARVRHRGAFEQAYVGFTMLLGRLWKCRSPRLHQLPLQWFADIERGFASPASVDASEYCATRRGAGLPFMIQALVTTELAVEATAPRGRLLSRCLRLCLSVARAAPTPEAASRAHLVLRALYRHAAPAAEDTQEAFMVAVRGFEADTWMERNSSTLLFSALCVRVFGVPRTRDARHLCVRNRMTGRIFFLRYPALYDFLLDQLKTSSPESTLRPSLFPTLLLLARLYPSALEGTVSNLKLERFLPHLVQLAGARDAATRRLAARAAATLVPPQRYVAHIHSLLVTLGDPTIERNLCHGLLCQLTVLLDLKPEVALEERARSELLTAVRGTFWIAAHASGVLPCYIVADEWLRVINLILLRFPKLLDNDLKSISKHLEAVLFSTAPAITSGRETFLSNSVYMLLIVETILCRNVTRLVIRCLLHEDYEVNLSALNYLLVLHDDNEDSCQFLDHLSHISDKDILNKLEMDEDYVKTLCVTGNYYLECKRKALKVLAFTKDTQKDIVNYFNKNILSIMMKSHKNAELNDESIMMKSHKNVELNDESIMMKSHKNAELNDESIMMESHKNVQLYDESIMMKSHKNVELNDESIMMKSHKNAELNDESIMMESHKNSELNDESIMMESHKNVQLYDESIMMKSHKNVELNDESIMMKSHENFELNDESIMMKRHKNVQLYDESIMMKSHKNLELDNESIMMKSHKNAELNNDFIMLELIDSIRNGHASFTSIYLESLLRFASESRVSLEVVRVLYECSGAGREEGCRGAVGRFLESGLRGMMQPTCGEHDLFEWVATLTATVAILLEDDAPAVRQRAANAVLTAVLETDERSSQQVLPAHAARRWREAAAAAAAAAAGPALLLMMACLDFCADVHTGDELGEECRVFDQNETHNVYLEEFTWTKDCATQLKRIYRQTYTHTHTIDQFIQSLLNNPLYKTTIEKLCIENVADYLTGQKKSNNTKIELFLNILHK